MQNSKLFLQFLKSSNRKLLNEQTTIKNLAKNKIKSYLDSRIIKDLSKGKIFCEIIYMHILMYILCVICYIK
jgi:hypothetical protein